MPRISPPFFRIWGGGRQEQDADEDHEVQQGDRDDASRDQGEGQGGSVLSNVSSPANSRPPESATTNSDSDGIRMEVAHVTNTARTRNEEEEEEEEEEEADARESGMEVELQGAVTPVVHERGDASVAETRAEGREEMMSMMNFDLSLASSHLYLGESEDADGAAAIFPEGSYLDSLPLMQCSDLVLFPGQTLPLTVSSQDWQVISATMPPPPARKVIGVVGHVSRMQRDFTGLCGTIAEIRTSANSQSSTVSLVTLGRQRFVVESSTQRSWSISVGCVRVLEEPPPPRRPLCLREGLRDGPSAKPGARMCVSGGGSRGYWGSGVYDMYDAKRLAKVSRALFLSILGLPGDSGHSYASPDDPVAFSYWLACQLMVGQATRQVLLEAPSCVDRLRTEIMLLKRMGVMRCRRCRYEICSHKQAFCMSAEGPVSAFVNPGGVVHETATYFKAKHIVLIGDPSSEHSWFPGYTWTIGICGQCGSHLGWRFDAERPGMVPVRFWGLSRGSLCASRAAGWVRGGLEEVGSGESEGDEEDEDVYGAFGEDESEVEGGGGDEEDEEEEEEEGEGDDDDYDDDDDEDDHWAYERATMGF